MPICVEIHPGLKKICCTVAINQGLKGLFGRPKRELLGDISHNLSCCIFSVSEEDIDKLLSGWPI